MKTQYDILEEARRGDNNLRRNDTFQFRRDDDPSDEILGLEGDVKKIHDWILCPDKELQKIAIVGLGGLGKTTLARLIFNNDDVSKHFQKKIWVSVSQTFKEDDILQKLQENLGRQPASQTGSTFEDGLKQIISQLEEISCLIVLDDIWDNRRLDWWKKKFFPALSQSSHKQSCVIITTRDEGVANAIGVDESFVHKPKFLNEADSWSLFYKHAFAKVEKNCSEKFKDLGKKIVARCGGLPLAIKTIGGLLGSTGSLHEWNGIWKSFCEPSITKENDVITSLQLSYKALPVELKQCLLSFSIFPEDSEIEAEKLIQWWVAEGLIQDTERGFENLSKLVRRCLVEVVKKRGYNLRIYKCRMHDLVRDLTLVMAHDEKLCFFDCEGKQNFHTDSRWLGFTREMDAESLKKSPKLRALILMNKDHAQFHRNLSSLHSLRALDLSNNKLDKVALNNLFKWISSLKRLAYLNLSEAKGLEEVPDSIGKLRNLQLLVLSGCTNLSKLSSSISYLKKMVLLDVGSCDKLPYLPHGLHRLSHLQELSGLRLELQTNKRSCRLLELQHLRELRVLRIRLSNDSEIIEKERNVLSELKKLKILAIDFDIVEKSEDKHLLDKLDMLCPPSTLEQLYFKRYNHERLPKWVSPESLPALVYLCVDEGRCLADISCKSEAMSWNIEGLCLKELPQLNKDWKKLINEEMKLLRYAEISSCSKLVNFPDHMDDKPVWRRNQHR
ncbi:hypothetical protein JCGZ_01849 [Jatropha curcas]|uniref:AAA+ ATPase domain-containing protein n=2 Tax=Jatropha curcas TaxID=180498 RepID=A0A067L0S0_JATCU|nr:hypothetical protein JCGZ_01849 [Jatropha curcas]